MGKIRALVNFYTMEIRQLEVMIIDIRTRLLARCNVAICDKNIQHKVVLLERKLTNSEFVTLIQNSDC